jgi:hypothetical protein
MSNAAEEMKQANLDTNVILFSMWTEAVKNFAEYGSLEENLQIGSWVHRMEGDRLPPLMAPYQWCRSFRCENSLSTSNFRVISEAMRRWLEPLPDCTTN